MEEDEVCLDVECTEVCDALLDVSEEGGIRAAEIVATGGIAFERVERRFIVVVLVAFWKNAHADLVEGGVTERGKRLLLDLL